MNDEFRNDLDEKLSKVLTGAAASAAESSFSDCDAFRDWLEEGQHRRTLNRHRKIRRAAVTAAAVFLCALLLSGGLLLLPGTLCSKLPPSLQVLLTPGEGVASPDSEQNITYENGSIVIGGDGNGNVGTWTATFASYDDLPEKYQKQIIWFEDMPEGYELAEIEVTRNINNTEYLFIHRNSLEELRIKQFNYGVEIDKTIMINQYDEILIIDGIEIYLKKSKDWLRYSFKYEQCLLQIFVDEEMEYKKIETMIASIRTGLNSQL